MLTPSTKVSNYFFTENIIQIKLVQFNDLWKWCARYWIHATFCFDILNSGKILRQKRHQSEKYYRLKILNKYLFSHERKIQFLIILQVTKFKYLVQFHRPQSSDLS